MFSRFLSLPSFMCCGSGSGRDIVGNFSNGRFSILTRLLVLTDQGCLKGRELAHTIAVSMFFSSLALLMLSRSTACHDHSPGLFFQGLRLVV